MNGFLRLIVHILLLSLATGCLESGFDFTPIDNATHVQYTISNTYSGANDAFKIVGISPDGENLKLHLTYSGGCNIHTFNVVWNGEISEDATGKEIFLKVFHQSNDDKCEALLKPTVSIDLGDALQDYIPDEETRVTIQNASNGRSIEISPILGNVIQSTSCQVKAKFVNSLCGYGVWQNNWFRMEDSLGMESPVWLQPVAYHPDIGAEFPDLGDYDLGIDLLIGYESPKDITCLTIPEGLVLPVSINCISRIN